MHEEEERAASEAMSAARSTGSYVIGEIDENDIDALKAKGLIIQEIADAPSPPLANLSPALTTASKKIGLERATREFDPTRPSIYTIRLAGPLLEEWRQELTLLGVKIIESIGPQLYTAELQPAQVSPVRNLPFVTTIHVHDEEEKAPPIPTSKAGPPINPGVDQILTYDIRLKSPADAAAVLNRLSGRDVLVAGTRGRKIRRCREFLRERSVADSHGWPEAD
jgi:hypothetical protein